MPAHTVHHTLNNQRPVQLAPLLYLNSIVPHSTLVVLYVLQGVTPPPPPPRNAWSVWAGMCVVVAVRRRLLTHHRRMAIYALLVTSARMARRLSSHARLARLINIKVNHPSLPVCYAHRIPFRTLPAPLVVSHVRRAPPLRRAQHAAHVSDPIVHSKQVIRVVSVSRDMISSPTSSV